MSDDAKPPMTVAELRQMRNKLHPPGPDARNAMDRAAVWITDKVGTMGFFLVIFIWTVGWLGWNILVPEGMQFDKPMGFVVWLFISNVIQIMLMPLIMLGQNVQARHADKRAEYDLQVNLKAEAEVEAILYHLERQVGMLQAMMERQGAPLPAAPPLR